MIFCETEEDARTVVAITENWLSHRGLTLSKEKTRIVHITEGFDFLGFNIRQFRTRRKKSGWKAIIQPSQKTEKAIRAKLKDTWLSLRGSNVATVIKRLNPIIRGWSNYYRLGQPYHIFKKLDKQMNHRELRYVRRTHPHKSRKWIDKKQFWGQYNPKRTDKWVFGDKQTGAYLLQFRWFPVKRHIMVKGNASPDDPTLKDYWQQRRIKEISVQKKKIQPQAYRQNGICACCGESLFNDEEIHQHHILPKSEGGSDRFQNIELVHLYCHQQIHALEKCT